jgi:hypothetical protein
MKVGSIVLVAWDIAASERRGVIGLEPDFCEGRVTGIKGSKVTIHFWYGFGFDPQEEIVVIDLESGLDSVDRGVVREIVMKSHA